MRISLANASVATAILFTLSSCDDAPGFDASLYENDAGETVIRHLHANLPEFRGDKHIHCIVLGSIPRGANPSFVERFEDIALSFVQSDRLAVRPEDHVPYDPKTELSPIFLQVATPTNQLESGDTVEAAWAYKRKFRKFTLTLSQSGEDEWTVDRSEVAEESLDGSWKPDWQR